MNAFNVALDGQAVRTWGAMVSGNYFAALGVSTELGRDFLPEEYAVPERHPVVLISHSLWQRRFGSDPAVVGRTVSVNGTPFTVVGVVDREFRGGMVGTYSDIYVPLAMCQSALPGWSYFGRSNHWLTSVVARLGDNVSIDKAQTEVDALMAGLRERYPDSNRGGNAVVLPAEESLLHPGIRGGFQAVFALLTAVVGVLMLLTCANVAGLMLARSAARQGEFGVRIALGAGRSRLIRQLLTECVLYALAAGCVGFVLVILVVPVVVSIQPPVDLPIQFGATLGVTSAWITLLASLIAAFLFGMAPALAAGRRDVASSLGSGGTTANRPLQRLRHLLVAGQIAASLLLLVGAGLGFRSLQQLRKVDLGFDPGNQLVLRLDLSTQGYEESSGRIFYRDLREQLLEVPGVQKVGLSKRILLNFDRSISLVWPNGWESPGGRPESISRNLVDEGYFDAMRMPLVAGRGFLPSGADEPARVIVVNQHFADLYWPGQNAVGKRVRLHKRDDGPVYEVAGVVATAKYQSVGEDPEPYFYRSFNQLYDGDMCVHVKTARDPELYIGDVRRIVAALDPDLALSRLTTMSDQVRFALLPSRLIAFSVLVFASAALLLTAIGLYGLIGYTVTQQTREIGIRMAIGAGRGILVRQVLGRILTHSLAGLGVGLGLAIMGTVLASRVLYGVSALDPIAVGTA
jgi:predicted permease